MSEVRHTRLLIIGSGPAGYTAAVYGARAMLKPILIQGIQPGGQLTITTEVENWPGDVEVQGPALMERMEAHAKATGTEVIADHIARLELDKRPFTAIGDGGTVYTADAVVLAARRTTMFTANASALRKLAADHALYAAGRGADEQTLAEIGARALPADPVRAVVALVGELAVISGSW